MSLKHKTIKGLKWSILDNILRLFINFVSLYILARILSPEDFGLIGMTTFFISLANIFVDSGISAALIRKTDCKEEDFTTGFIYNLILGFIFFILLFIISEYISKFFKEPILKEILRALSFLLIINSLGLVHRTMIIKELKFKLQTKISLYSSLLSNAICILLAIMNFGVWSLVFKIISFYSINTIFFWLLNKWKPKLKFDIKSFQEIFNFSLSLLIGSIIYQIYRSIFYIIIGKFFKAQEVGYYNKAEQIANLPSQNLYSIIQRVTYPILAQVNSENDNFSNKYLILFETTLFITIIPLFFLFSTSSTLINFLLGSKWIDSIIYLKYLSISAIFFPLHELNINFLKVKGKSNYILFLEIIEKLFLIPVIYLGIKFGLKILLFGLLLHSFLSYILNFYITNFFIKINLKKLVYNNYKTIIIAFLLTLITLFLETKINIKSMLKFLLESFVFLVFFFLLNEKFKNQPYVYLKETLIEHFKLK